LEDHKIGRVYKSCIENIMKYILILFLFFTALTAHASTKLSGRCVSVTDGDTLKISVNNREIKIRLDGVDCPEIQQAFGANAKQFTQQWSLGRNLIVYVTGTDRYQRALGWVFFGKRCLNNDLVYNGMAWWYRQYAPTNTKLKNLEAYARSKRRGLWKSPNPTPPWTWRHRR
jgi:endonuclease YncB( thermonuclease family)